MASKAQVLKRDQVLSALVETRKDIITRASALSKEEQEHIFLGIWSVKDLIAHLAGWDFTNLEAVKSVLAGKVPAFYEQHDRDWQTYNATLVKKYTKDSFRELLATVRDSQKKLVEYLQSVPPEHFSRDFGVRFRGYKVTVQRLLEAEIKDEQVHCRQVIDFFKESR